MGVGERVERPRERSAGIAELAGGAKEGGVAAAEIGYVAVVAVKGGGEGGGKHAVGGKAIFISRGRSTLRPYKGDGGGGGIKGGSETRPYESDGGRGGGGEGTEDDDRAVGDEGGEGGGGDGARWAIIDDGVTGRGRRDDVSTISLEIETGEFTADDGWSAVAK